MKRLFASLMMATMLVPTGALASSIRPGSRHSIKSSPPRSPRCMDDEEKFTEKCEVTVDETGVKAQDWHITDVVQWSTEEKPFNIAGGIVGGAAGAGVGFAAGLGSCAIIGPFCLLTAPAIMQTGAGVGAGAGGTARGKFFTIVGDDAKGNRLIKEFWIPSGKKVKALSKDLLNTTKLVEGETR